MRRITLIIVWICLPFYTCLNYAQTFEENFNYPVGAFDTLSSNWVGHYSGDSAHVVSGSLTYSNYSSSGISNMLLIDSSGRDYRHSFTNINSGTIYWSFLLKVIDNASLQRVSASGDYFINFQKGSSGIGLLDIHEGTNINAYQLGLQKNSKSTTNYLTSKQLSFGHTYLIVLAYTFNTGDTTDDEIKLWIDPSLAGTEPAPDLICTDTLTDASYLNEIQIRQGTHTPNADIDGIRLSQSWSTSALPVELNTFTANVNDQNVQLNWLTSTEINNYGFEVQRSASSNSKNYSWNKIGFVKGNGNSNSVKYYSFIDNNIHTGKNDYRLKQIDNDGHFSYSKIVEVNLQVPANYKLVQNYPNPFNPSTTIKYMIPKASHVKITIFNSLGKKVKTLIDKFKEPGSYSIRFTSDELSSGLYFYRLEAGSFSQVKKMILLK